MGHRYALAAILAIGIALALASWLISPRLNTSPSEAIAISGAFPFGRGLDLRFIQSYETRNPLCERTVRMFAVVPLFNTSREASQLVSVQRMSGDAYQATIFSDYYRRGFCDWRPRFTLFQIFSEHQEPKWGATATALLGFPKVVTEIDWKCRMLDNNRNGLLCLQQSRGAMGSQRGQAIINFSWDDSIARAKSTLPNKMPHADAKLPPI